MNEQWTGRQCWLVFRLCIGLSLTVNALGADPEIISDEAITAITSAEFALVAGADIPTTAEWQSVSLTDKWPIERYEVSREGWYRLNVVAHPQAGKRFSIYLRRLNMNAQVYLNGVLVATGGQFEEPVARNWNYPMYAEVPASLWKDGVNTIHIRLISYRGYGYISPVYIGPAKLLKKEYDTAFIMQVQLARYLFPVTLVTGLFIFLIWLRRRKESIYLWFAVSTFFWSIYIVNMFVRQLIIPTRVWEWIAHLSIELWVVAFFVFSYRFAALHLGKIAWVLAGYVGIAAVVYAYGDLYQLKGSVVWFHGASLALCLVLILRLTARWMQVRSSGLMALIIGLAILFATGVHDWMFQTGIVGVTGTLSLHLHYYCAPLVFAFIAWHLTSRYARAADELEDLNLHLEQRIADAEAELSVRINRIRTMEQREAILHERERIAREIHDAIGGRFSSAIMVTNLMERKDNAGGRTDVLKKILTDGLTEVRHLVTAMVGDINNSIDLIYYIADKTSATLRSVDIEFDVNFDLSDESWTISNSEALNIVRVMQEATNNIIKHSRATAVKLTASDRRQQLTISLDDNGIGLSNESNDSEAQPETFTSRRSYGIDGMKKRCREIQAMLAIETNDEGGCRVKLSFERRS